MVIIVCSVLGMSCGLVTNLEERHFCADPHADFQKFVKSTHDGKPIAGWSIISLEYGAYYQPFHSQVHSPNFKEKCISEVMRIGGVIILHLSEL